MTGQMRGWWWLMGCFYLTCQLLGVRITRGRSRLPVYDPAVPPSACLSQCSIPYHLEDANVPSLGGGIPITPSPVLIIRTCCMSPHPSNTDSTQPLCCANQETPPKAPSQHQLTFRSQAPLEQGSANIWKGPDWKYFLLQGPGCLCGNDSTLLCSIKAAWDKR